MLKIQGSTLIEVLVNMLIITSAGLGTLYLLSVSQREQTTIALRSEARALSMEIYHRSRINAAPDTASFYEVSGTDPAAQKNCQNTTCSRSELAQHDIGIWTTKVSQHLPGSQHEITVGASSMTVNLAWKALGAIKSEDNLCPTLTLAANEVCVSYTFAI